MNSNPPRTSILAKPPIGEAATLTLLAVALTTLFATGQEEDQGVNPTIPTEHAAWDPIIAENCFDCHDSSAAKGNIDFETALSQPLKNNLELWEKAVRQMEMRMMPPLKKKQRPSDEENETVTTALARALDQLAADKPHPGRTESLRRLNRTEYENVIRDLLNLEVNARLLLPADQSSHGFDNVTVGDLSPALLDRYLSAGQKISRRALGRTDGKPDGRTVRIRPDITQEERMEGLPLGTRGGTAFSHLFPVDGDYEFQIHLMRDRNEHVEGLNGTHRLEILIDGETVQGFDVKKPKNSKDHTHVDANLKVRLPIQAGNKKVGATFVAKTPALIETLRQPYEAAFNRHRHPRRGPAIYQVSVTGPFDAPSSSKSASPTFDEAARRDDAGAKAALKKIQHLACRGQADDEDFQQIMAFYEEGKKDNGVEGGLESALAAILVSPKFLFRVERDPENLTAGSRYRLSDLEIASRLSFFLWSSLPDEELLAAARKGQLQTPVEIGQQAARLLKDPRSRSLVTNFANQWLYLRNLDSITPDGRLYPDFDHNLREAMRRETEMHLESVISEDASILQLIDCDYTFLNERLAKHYEIPHVYGERMRQVQLPPNSGRGGLLRHGSILTVTSYATRTSPVLRGHWVLENLFGTPPPPPPPDIPALEDSSVSADLPVRQRLAKHRENPACASCHDVMDPIGFAFEHFDAIGQWRTMEADLPVDAKGALAHGTTFEGVAGLEAGILEKPDYFVRTVVEKLLTFALGRGIESEDAPAIRKIVREAAEKEYRISSLIHHTVTSEPFLYRTTDKP